MSRGWLSRQRIARIIDLVDREDRPLLAVRRRLLGSDFSVDSLRIAELLASEIGIDRLEFFGAKFARMQDTVVDKLIPLVLTAAGEKITTAIDNLGRMERFALIDSADECLAMRGLRNRRVHEYIDRPAELALALDRACQFTDRMHTDYHTIRDYAVTRFGIELGQPGT